MTNALSSFLCLGKCIFLKDIRDPNKVGKGLLGVQTTKQLGSSLKDAVLGSMGSTCYRSFISMTPEVTGLLQDQVGLHRGVWGSPGPGCGW